MNPLSAVARLVVAVAVSCAIAAPASAGRQFVRQVHGCAPVVQQVIQPAYNHTPYASATYNFVGAPVRLQAEQAYTMKNDPQWAQFQQWKAQQQTQQMAQALFQQWSAAQGQQAAPVQPYAGPGTGSGWIEGQPQTPQQAAAEQEYARQHPGWGPPGVLPPGPPPAVATPDGSQPRWDGQWKAWYSADDRFVWEKGAWIPNAPQAPTGSAAELPSQPTAPGPLPPAAPGVPNAATPNVHPHAAKMPLLIQYCGRCHTTEKPAGEFAFDGSVDYLIKGDGPAAEEMARKRDQILQAIVSQRMPKDGALEPMVAGAIVAELYSAE